jgi:pimeloyl-ACP methyl ester carboxylesterase
MCRYGIAFLFALGAAAGFADGPGDNLADKVRPIPPPGIAVPPNERGELQAGVDDLGKEIETLRTELKSKPAGLELLPDVQIFHNAVRYALKYNEFYDAKELAVARSLLKQGMERAQALHQGKAPWNTASGLIVRGYQSRIDGSVQPYGLVVPASYQPTSPNRYRLDAWFHGRGEKLTELSFLDGRQKSPGEFTPAHAFVLHPYGRYCNANKFAGETDFSEALEHVRRHYPIDENRMVVRGFSMGGAACWQFAVHHAGLWAAAAPGAGFSETPDFLKVFQNETLKPAWYEQKLWHLYDATDWALNLFNCPTVAYSGELDQQKQAADKMVEALAKEGMSLMHIIGPQTRHAYHPQAKLEINRRIDSIVAQGRNPVPRQIKFTTWTLRYNRMLWLTVDGLDQHWEQARVLATIDNESRISVKTQNVSAFTLSMAPGQCPLDETKRPHVAIDKLGESHDKPADLEAPPMLSDRSWTAHFRKEFGEWKIVPSADDGKLRKQHGLQGPIDDAFMDSFLMVRPTGKPLNEKVGKWVDAEMNHAIEHWRRQFRGEAPVKNDDAISDADIARSNLVLWGDPSSNKILARILGKLPLEWRAEIVGFAHHTYDAAHFVPVMIYPNPLNPKRYIVLNSGFTFREYDYLNNARQTPKLPDWAMIDIDVPPSSRAPGAIGSGGVSAGFFGETWGMML